MKKSLFLLASLLCISVSSAYAATANLGAGYSCQGTEIFRGAHVVAARSARADINRRIAALGSSRADAAKKMGFAKLKSKFIDCGNGQQIGAGEPAVSNPIGLYGGRYELSKSRIVKKRHECAFFQGDFAAEFEIFADGARLVSNGAPFFGKYSGGVTPAGFRLDAVKRTETSALMSLSLVAKANYGDSLNVDLTQTITRDGALECQVTFSGWFIRIR